MLFLYIFASHIFSMIITLMFAENSIKIKLDFNNIYNNNECLIYYLNSIEIINKHIKNK